MPSIPGNPTPFVFVLIQSKIPLDMIGWQKYRLQLASCQCATWYSYLPFYYAVDTILR